MSRFILYIKDVLSRHFSISPCWGLGGFIVLLSLAITDVTAQELTPDSSRVKIEKSTMIAIGGMNRYDTYLSPLEYRGTDVRFISSVLRVRPSKWDMQFTHEGAFDYTENPSGNGEAMAGHYNFAFSMMHRWQMMGGKLTLRAGGMTELMLGFAYNMRNTANNPAQGYAQWAIGGAGMASYDFTLLKQKFRVNYEARLPLVGIMFSPNYGQSYYEMFSRDNYDHNIVCYGIDTPTFRHMLSLEMATGKRSAVTVGYLGDIRQAKPNNLRQHTYTNSFVIGFKVNR